MIRGLSQLFLVCVLLLNLGGCAALFLSGAATTMGVLHDRRSTGTVIDDQGIELSIFSAIASDPQLAQGVNISVTSYNRMVLLSGQVMAPGLARRAEAIAVANENVRQVHNELVVAPPQSWSNTGTDALISSMVKSSLFQIQLPDFDPSRVDVITDNGTVFLMGLVYPQEAEAVTATVRQVNGVQRVVKLFEYL